MLQWPRGLTHYTCDDVMSPDAILLICQDEETVIKVYKTNQHNKGAYQEEKGMYTPFTRQSKKKRLNGMKRIVSRRIMFEGKNERPKLARICTRVRFVNKRRKGGVACEEECIEGGIVCSSAHPTKRRVVRKLLDEGRLEILTGGWVMTDEANVHIYAMLDQLIEVVPRGKSLKYYRRYVVSMKNIPALLCYGWFIYYFDDSNWISVICSAVTWFLKQPFLQYCVAGGLSTNLMIATGSVLLVAPRRGFTGNHSYSIVLRNVMNSTKYRGVTKVVKACLSSPHGNSDVERDFSTSGDVITQKTAAMKERALNAQLIVIDSLKFYGNKPACVPITKELIAYGRNARIKYHQYLEQSRTALPVILYRYYALPCAAIYRFKMKRYR
uniref:Glycoside hydrolase family 38 N-terminal domain-containing protein n=1 Tax=Timema bartmani TaxID=61472 RepID=A0A7R9HXH9_9NEOP|nr:unnamed protein product [Timema bartmani]